MELPPEIVETNITVRRELAEVIDAIISQNLDSSFVETRSRHHRCKMKCAMTHQNKNDVECLRLKMAMAMLICFRFS